MPWLHFRITNQIRFLEIAILCNKEFVMNDRLVILSCPKRKKSMFTQSYLRKFSWYFLSKYHTCVYIIWFIKRDTRRYRIIHQYTCKKKCLQNSFIIFYYYLFLNVDSMFTSFVPQALTSDMKSNKCLFKLVFYLQSVKLTSFQV